MNSPLVATGILLAGLVGCADPIEPRPPGAAWVAFKGPDQPFRNNHVNAIVTTRAGPVWIGTDSGVVFFERGLWGAIVDSVSYVALEAGEVVRRAKVAAITQGKDGSVWFGTNGGGLRRFFPTAQSAGARWIGYAEPLISSNVITSLACEIVVNGDVWAGTQLFGVNRFLPSSEDPRFGEWRTYTASDVPAFGSNQISSAAFNVADNAIWVSSIFRLAVFINDVTGWRSYPSAGAYDYTILGMATDLGDNLWVGKRDGAALLDRYRDWTYLTAGTTGGRLPAGPVNAVTTDLLSTRWFGTERGLARLRDTTWTLFNRANTELLLSDTVTALAYDQYGNLWIGTANGVNVFNEKGVFF